MAITDRRLSETASYRALKDSADKFFEKRNMILAFYQKEFITLVATSGEKFNLDTVAKRDYRCGLSHKPFLQFFVVCC